MTLPADRLRGPWLSAARFAGVAFVLLAAAIFVVSVPVYFGALHEACPGGPCLGGQLSPENMRALGRIGLSVDLYAAYVLALDLTFALGFCVVGAVIFWRRSREAGPLLASFALVMFGLTWPGAFEAARRFGGWGEPVGGFLFELSLASLVALLLVFPDGAFVPRWTRWVVVAGVVNLVSKSLFPDSILAKPPQWLNLSLFVGVWAVCLLAQVYRYRWVSGPVERQQAKWLVFGVAALVVLLFAFSLPYVLFPDLDRPGVLALSYDMVGRAVVNTFAFLLIPLSIGVAILRHRLYDIDVIINRTLVYGTLTVSLGLVYLGSVIALESVFSTLTGGGSQLAVVASTLVIAALFNPLRRRVQDSVDRRFYRRKYDVRETLEAFSAKLRNETDLGRLKEDLTGAVRETMQPEHVSLWLREPEEKTRR